ncbi:MAG TPA: hypothetical protein VGR46_10850 [Candidatus Limnocylindria bacterium]|jgi:hypothetical protein|nr:hypothetical protein [Candidatus Limnocylindria bacterium]
MPWLGLLLVTAGFCLLAAFCLIWPPVVLYGNDVASPNGISAIGAIFGLVFVIAGILVIFGGRGGPDVA